MTQTKFDEVTETNDNELYFVEGNATSLPSDQYIDLALAVSGSTYTAPANGYFYLSRAASTNEYIVLENQNTGIGLNTVSVNGSSVRSLFPVRKGDVVCCSYTASGTINYFRFIYAQGEV